VTVVEVIQRSSDFLAKKGVESPRLQVELLLAHLLKLPRMKLYLNFDRVLTDGELDELRKMVLRRSLREPLQHITGSTSFCGLEMLVNRNVLVPRPETELLAEMGWEFLDALSSEIKKSGLRGGPLVKDDWRQGPFDTPHAKDFMLNDGELPQLRVLDFGTGSGCLAITLAVKNPGTHVVAVDISSDALIVARRNAAVHQMESRISFIEGDGFTALVEEPPFDLMVTNPPYIASDEIATLDPEVRDHDPRLALDGGGDGLDFYRRLAREAAVFLKPGAKIMMEFGDGQAAAIEDLFRQEKWIVEAVKTDYSGRPRILTAQPQSKQKNN
jgi:release factor glutamine methyltransferase